MTNIAQCKVAIAGITEEPSEKSILISQMLFGEYCEILRQEGLFSQVHTASDGTTGWIFTQNIAVAEQINIQKVYTKKWEEIKMNEGELLVSFGAELLENTGVLDLKKTDLELIARQFLHAPYLSGGRSIFGIDADGLSQLIYKSINVNLPRKASEQAKYGKVLDFIEEYIPGDLAFFENENKEINHVGIMLSEQCIMHAYGKVRIDDLDSCGIYNREIKKHTHRLRFIKRMQ